MAFLVSPTVQMPFWKIFCPLEVNTQLNKNTLTAGDSLFLARSTSCADCYRTFEQT